MSVECLQIRPGPRSLVHFTGEEVTGWFFRPRVPGMLRRRQGLRARCALCCLPAPGLWREGTAGPAGEVPLLPNPRLRRLQDCRGRSVFSLLDSTSLVWKPSEEVIIFPKEFGFVRV